MKVIEIINRLCKNNFEIYTVGGYVRDSFLDKHSKDVDLATNAKPDELKELFKDYNITFAGKTFPVVFIDNIEVATYRKDRYYGLDHTACEVTYADNLLDDLDRRDFSINSMALCEKSGKLIDPHNGLNDLENRIIRFVGNPKDRIHEDPDRILRACRFKALINGRFHEDTLDALLEYAHYVKDYVAPERIRLEILKAMKTKKASRFFRSLLQINALQYIFPSLMTCVNHPHGDYHDEDIWSHSMLTGDAISPKCSLTKLCGYLHDVGKPKSYDPKEGSFIGHEFFSREIIIEELTKLKFSNKEIEYVSDLARAHMYSFKTISPRAVRRLLVHLQEKNIFYIDFLKLKIADRRANLKKKDYPYRFKDIKGFINMFEDQIYAEVPFDIKSLAIDGNDVMKTLNISPSPEVGRILKELFQKVLEDPELNEKEILLKLIKEI